MTSFIPKDFAPDPDTVNQLRKKGIFEDFLGEMVTPEFLLYWNDLKGKQEGKKKSWQRTFYTWAIRSFEGKTGRLWEENRHQRERYSTGVKGDLFGEVLDKINGSERAEHKERREPRPRLCGQLSREPACGSIPTTAATMTFEQAQAELRRMRIIK